MEKEFVQIHIESMKNLLNGSSEEMASVLYDTLQRNKLYPQFKDEFCGGCEIEGDSFAIVYLGHTYTIKVTLTD